MISINGIPFNNEEEALEFIGYKNTPKQVLEAKILKCKKLGEPVFYNGFKIQWEITRNSKTNTEIYYKLYNNLVLKYFNNELIHTYSELFFKESHKDIYLKLKNEINLK